MKKKKITQCCLLYVKHISKVLKFYVKISVYECGGKSHNEHIYIPSKVIGILPPYLKFASVSTVTFLIEKVHKIVTIYIKCKWPLGPPKQLFASTGQVRNG